MPSVLGRPLSCQHRSLGRKVSHFDVRNHKAYMTKHTNLAFLKVFNTHLSDDDLPITDPGKSQPMEKKEYTHLLKC